MKNIFKYFVAAALGTASIVSCSVEDRFVEDTSQVYFTDNELTRAVSSVVPYADVEIPYALTTPADGNHTVNLVYDPQFSNAVPTTDFEILSGDEISSGEVTGTLKLRIFSNNASSEGKIANFKISSSSLSNLKDQGSLKLQLLKTCPLNTFTGSFANTMGWWSPGQVVDIVEDPNVPNKLIAVNFFGNGTDLPLTYDPVSYVITVPDMFTGDSTGQGEVRIRTSQDGAKSSFNSCTRTVKLFVNYYIAGVGAYGNYEERFIGL